VQESEEEEEELSLSSSSPHTLMTRLRASSSFDVVPLGVGVIQAEAALPSSGSTAADLKTWRNQRRREVEQNPKAPCQATAAPLFGRFIDHFLDTAHAGGGMVAPPPPPPPARRPHDMPLYTKQGVPTFILPTRQRVVAIGDLHGDLGKSKEAFRLAGLIDKDGHWSGGKTLVVQVGDQLDRGDDEIALLYWLERLKYEAHNAGGMLVTMNGNHETMNVSGHFRYATPGAMASYERWRALERLGERVKGGAKYAGRRDAGRASSVDAAAIAPPMELVGEPAGTMARFEALQPGGPITLRFLAPQPTVLVVGSSVFVHAGLLPGHVEQGLNFINAATCEWMRGHLAVPNFLLGRHAVVWTRAFSHIRRDRTDCATLTESLSALRQTNQAPFASRMIMGHTIQQPGGLNSACNGAALRVDVGLSKGCGDAPPEVLEILDDGRGGVRRVSKPTHVGDLLVE